MPHEIDPYSPNFDETVRKLGALDLGRWSKTPSIVRRAVADLFFPYPAGLRGAVVFYLAYGTHR
jgi:hypothetical protein